DPESPVRMRFEEVAELRRLRAGADDQGRAEVVAAGAHPARENAERDLLRRQEDPVDESEENEKPAADEIQPQAENEQDEKRGAAERDAGRPPHLLAERLRPMAPIEARRRQQKRPEREDEEEEQQIAIERNERQGKERRDLGLQHPLAQGPGHRQ